MTAAGRGSETRRDLGPKHLPPPRVLVAVAHGRAEAPYGTDERPGALAARSDAIEMDTECATLGDARCLVRLTGGARGEQSFAGVVHQAEERILLVEARGRNSDVRRGDQ